MHSNNVVHFAIQAGDVTRAKSFYQHVFGWKFEEWGPPDFYLIQTGSDEDRGIRGALQHRTEPLQGSESVGYECSISVQDINATCRAIEDHGGQIVVKKVEIPTVGKIVKFADTEGNIACVVQYEPGAA